MARFSAETLTMALYHSINTIKIENGVLSLTVDGKLIETRVDHISRRLAEASATEIRVFEVSPSGYGIHWPLIDEDISIDALLGIAHTPTHWEKIA
jgi:hypothetical protein